MASKRVQNSSTVDRDMSFTTSMLKLKLREPTADCLPKLFDCQMNLFVPTDTDEEDDRKFDKSVKPKVSSTAADAKKTANNDQKSGKSHSNRKTVAGEERKSAKSATVTKAPEDDIGRSSKSKSKSSVAEVRKSVSDEDRKPTKSSTKVVEDDKKTQSKSKSSGGEVDRKSHSHPKCTASSVTKTVEDDKKSHSHAKSAAATKTAKDDRAECHSNPKSAALSVEGERKFKKARSKSTKATQIKTNDEDDKKTKQIILNRIFGKIATRIPARSVAAEVDQAPAAQKPNQRSAEPTSPSIYSYFNMPSLISPIREFCEAPISEEIYDFYQVAPIISPIRPFTDESAYQPMHPSTTTPCGIHENQPRARPATMLNGNHPTGFWHSAAQDSEKRDKLNTICKFL